MRKATQKVKLGSEVMVPANKSSMYHEIRRCGRVPGTVIKTAYHNSRVLVTWGAWGHHHTNWFYTNDAQPCP